MNNKINRNLNQYKISQFLINISILLYFFNFWDISLSCNEMLLLLSWPRKAFVGFQLIHFCCQKMNKKMYGWRSQNRQQHWSGSGLDVLSCFADKTVVSPLSPGISLLDLNREIQHKHSISKRRDWKIWRRIRNGILNRK